MKTLLCEKCGKEIDTSKEYSNLCYEVGDRNNETVAKEEIKKWDALEDERGVTLCFGCTKIFREAEDAIVKYKKIKKQFLTLIK